MSRYVVFLSIIVASLFVETSSATTDATCLIYKPIDMRSEGTVIKLPKGGFIILAVPYLSGFSVPEKPYYAISRPYLMDSMRKNQNGWDSNLVSRVGIKIQSYCRFDGIKVKDEVVTVDVTGFRGNDYDPSLDVILEATLECIRLTAMDKHQKWRRPILRIIDKTTNGANWTSWVDRFNSQDFSMPFKRPQSPETRAEQGGTRQPATRPESESE